MTSSSSSSSSARALGLLAALALAGCSAARPPPERPAPPRLALFPVQNLTGGRAPVKEITAALRAQLLTYGVVLVPDEVVMRTLAAHRIRYTGGVDRETATALRDEAGADGVIIPSLEIYQPAPPFRMAMTTRLVTTGAEPAIQWIDSFARSGIDAPGLLAMGDRPGHGDAARPVAPRHRGRAGECAAGRPQRHSLPAVGRGPSRTGRTGRRSSPTRRAGPSPCSRSRTPRAAATPAR